jgi:hypothetical protein
MSKKSYAEKVNDAQVMHTGMQSNQTIVASRGWSTANTGKLNTTRTEVVKLNDEQEKLKAQLKTKTAELDAKMSELDTQMKEAKRVVKLGFPQTQWKEFGIADKR